MKAKTFDNRFDESSDITASLDLSDGRRVLQEQQREANDKAAEANSGAAPGSLASMTTGVDPVTRNARMAESSQKRQKLTQRSDALTARPVTAYAALTGKSEAEVKAHVSNLPASADLTVEICAGLVP